MKYTKQNLKRKTLHRTCFSLFICTFRNQNNQSHSVDKISRLVNIVVLNKTNAFAEFEALQSKWSNFLSSFSSVCELFNYSCMKYYDSSKERIRTSFLVFTLENNMNGNFYDNNFVQVHYCFVNEYSETVFSVNYRSICSCILYVRTKFNI